jgi:ketosteroid isomerase-like protein
MSSAASSTSDIAREIHEMEREFTLHANTGDAAALTECFYAEDAQLLPPGASIVRGKAAIREFWTGFLALGVADVVLETQEAGAGGDIAYGVGRYSYTMDGARHEGKYLVAFRRQPDGGYKAVADAFNADA